MESSASDPLIFQYTSPTDDMARLYVADRVARVFCTDGSGLAAVDELMPLSAHDAMRFVCWNHQECYGRLAAGAQRN